MWKQGTGAGCLAGHVAFHVNNLEGAGSMQFGSSRETVTLDYLHPTYACDVSVDAGAYVVKEGPGAYTLKWDESSTEWENATWITDALMFTYWVEQSPGSVVGNKLLQTAIVFNDTKTGNSWDVLPRMPGNTGAFSSSIDRKGLFNFNVNPGCLPNPDDRSRCKDSIKTVFPFQMAFNFDHAALNITGGAMLCSTYSVNGDVYAMRGKNQNIHAVGVYSLLSEKGDQFGELATHSRKLIIGGKPVPSSGVSGDRLWWEGLSPEDMKQTGLPANGFVEFSSGGHVIKGSSFGVRGIRQLASTASEPSLQLYDLLNMNPHVCDDQNNWVDKVQQNAMDDFYKILQYYMPSDYLHDFIAPNPPDIRELRDIAEDDKAKNSQWYGSLAVPYLVQALAQDKVESNNDLAKLNARRAQAILKESTSTSPIFKDQSTKLYSYEWKNMFPLMTKFLQDQEDNAASYQPAIEKDATQWILEMSEGLDKAIDPDEKKQLQEMIDMAKHVRDTGTQGKYWAYVLFRYLTTTYLSMLQMQMMNGNTSQQVTQNILCYCAVLSILDPTSFFAQQFIQVIGV